MKNEIRFFFGLVVFFLFINDILAITTHEAEDAYVIYQGVVESEHAGFTGTGYVNFNGIVGAYCEWLVSKADSGNYTLYFYYANGSTTDRPMKITVNSIVIEASKSFPATGAWTNWVVDSLYIPLDSGLNIVKVETAATDGPNLDRIEISGEAGTPYYTLDFRIFGNGIVQTETGDSIYQEGTDVTVTAIPDSGYIFGGWKGVINSEDSIISVRMDSSFFLNVIFIRNGLYAKTNELIGWATYEGNVTGGEGGTVVTVSNQSELQTYAASSGPYIIQVNGTIDISPMGTEIPVGSDKTIIGLGDNATLNRGGLKVQDITNVIVKNLYFKDTYVTWEGKDTDYDAIEVNNSQYIWIDHCDFSHYDDGLADIKNASDYVTVSWCHFHNHNKVMLIGASDDDIQDIGHLNTTVHHCWFDGFGGNGIGQRLPRGRFGKIHVYNNYYNDVLIRGVEAGFDADIVVDNNYFLNSAMPHALVGGETGGNNKMNASGNIYINSGTRRDKNNKAFNPSDYYEYTYDATADVPVIVMLGAGVGADTVIGQPTSIREYAPGAHNNQIGTLYQNFPNPFQDKTMIRYQLSQKAHVSLKIFDIVGNEITTIVYTEQNEGEYTMHLDGTTLKPGLYFYQLNTSNQVQTRKMIVIQ